MLKNSDYLQTFLSKLPGTHISLSFNFIIALFLSYRFQNNL